MTNFEFYKDKMLSLAEEGHMIALRNGMIESCDGVLCSQCKFNEDDTIECGVTFLKWLYEEYVPAKPKPKLTKRERSFCEVVGEGWLARDKNGKLYLYNQKPLIRSYEGWFLVDEGNVVFLSNDFFPDFDFIRFEDNKPYSIIEMLEWETQND